jgi:inhibitor of Bruton tyrosine kinase
LIALSSFPAQSFPSEITPYRPPAAIRVKKVTSSSSSDGTFAVLSSAGEVFTFSLVAPSSAAPSASDRAPIVKPHPQRVWDLRKKFSAATDVALGADGALIICTESGHVYVRARNANPGAASKSFKFHRMPYLQRVVGVCANDTGAFGALRVESRPERIVIKGSGIAQDVAGVIPFAAWGPVREPPLGTRSRPGLGRGRSASDPALPKNSEALRARGADEDEEEGEDMEISKDVAALKHLLSLLKEDKECRELYGCGLFEREGEMARYGADMVVSAGGREREPLLAFPVHALISASRSSRLMTLLQNGPGSIIGEKKGGQSIKVAVNAAGRLQLHFSGCYPISVLILFFYLYSDELPTLWDRRVMWSVQHNLQELKASGIAAVDPLRVRSELQGLARLLEMPLLVEALQPLEKRSPRATMEVDMRALYHASFDSSMNGDSLLKPDIVLAFADRKVACHSLLLRARSPFFWSFFDEPVWTAHRRNAAGVIEVDMRHLRWQTMQFVCRFMCCGEEAGMFDTLTFVDSTDQLLDFLFEVIAAAVRGHLNDRSNLLI